MGQSRTYKQVSPWHSCNNTATQFRDTQYGHVIRLLSNKNLLRYPDEIDPSLWKKSLHQDTALTRPRLEKPLDPNDPANNSPRDDDTQEDSSQVPNTSQDVKEGKEIFLVDWCGPDDPEVTAPHELLTTSYPLTSPRILRTGPAAGSCLSASKSAS